MLDIFSYKNYLRKPTLYLFYLLVFFTSADGLKIPIGRNWNIFQILVITIYIIWLIKMLHQRRLNNYVLPKSIFFILVLFVMAMVIANLAMPDSPKYIPAEFHELSSFQQYGIVSYMYFFWILLNIAFIIALIKRVNSLDILRKVVRILICSSVFFCSYGILQFLLVSIFGPSVNDFVYAANYEYLRSGYVRLLSFGREPLYFASYLIALLGLMTPALILGKKSFCGIKRSNLLFQYILVSISLLLTKSFGGIVGLTVGVIFLFLFLIRENLVKINLKFIFLSGAIFALIAVFIGFNYNMLESKFSRMSDPDSGYGRIISILQAFKLIEQRPYFGIGLGNSVYFTTNGQIHNAYLNIAAELGVLGLISFLGFIGIVWKRLLRTFNKPKTDEIKLIAIGLMCALTAVLTQLMSFYAYMISLLWLLLGLSLALYRINIIESRD